MFILYFVKTSYVIIYNVIFVSINEHFNTRWLIKLPGDPFKLHPMIKLHEERLVGYSKQQIALHAQTLDPLNPRDYIDAFLIEKYRLETMSIELKIPNHFFTGTGLTRLIK